MILFAVKNISGKKFFLSYFVIVMVLFIPGKHVKPGDWKVKNPISCGQEKGKDN